jgi:lipopolysaccharide export system protein LptA
MMMTRLILAPMLALALFAATPAHAEKADRNKGTTLSATKRLVVNDQTRTQVLEGDAELLKGTLKITADRLEFRQDATGNQFAVAIGSTARPAKFRQKRDGKDLFVEGEAERIEYDGKADTVLFIRQAVVRNVDSKGTLVDETRGARLAYDNKTEVAEMMAGSGSASRDGRVSIFIAPPRAEGEAAAAATPPPATPAKPGAVPEQKK